VSFDVTELHKQHLQHTIQSLIYLQNLDTTTWMNKGLNINIPH